nr:pantoate--beta-alanine ligase [Pseudoxanthomonas sp.]
MRLIQQDEVPRLRVQELCATLRPSHEVTADQEEGFTRPLVDLDIPIEVVGIPTIREADGLAMSSRNRYLSKTERQQATAIFRALSLAAEKIRSGIEPQTATRSATRALSTQGFRVDYVTARNAETLAVPEARGEPLRLVAAAWLGKTRLIDNMAV